MGDKRREEKRKHPRMPVMIPVEYSDLTDFFVDYAVDISGGGMFIATGKDIEPGTRVEIKFFIPGCDSPFVATGKVVRKGSPPREVDGEDIPATGIGIQFDPLPEASREIVNRLWKENLSQ